MKTNVKCGCFFLLTSGILYTVERYFSIAIWSNLTRPILERGNGSYANSPDMPKLSTNVFVVIFLALGISFLICELCNWYIKKEVPENQKHKEVH